jgi:WD40 repeat protein
MDHKKKKCSLKEHRDVEAISYCQKCEIYICNQCEKNHLSLFPEHKTISLDKDMEIFTGLCKIENHQNELDYYCKNHNQLCCVKCIAKIKRKGTSQHADCEVCNIEDIVNEKKQNLRSNIKILEDLSKSLQTSINVVEKLNRNKEEIKTNIKNIFTKIKNAINSRENELLSGVDKQFERYLNENILKENEKLQRRIKISLEKGKLTDKNWNNNNNKLNSLVNDCLNIENDIKYINIINDKIKESKTSNMEIRFNSDDEIALLKKIKEFGVIKKDNNVQNNININVDDFNPQDISVVKKISDHCAYGDSYLYDGLCFFISKNKEYVLAYIDSNSDKKTIIFHDMNKNKEIKRIKNAHEKKIYMIKYYDYQLYDIVLTCSNNNDVKLWNYNENINILTISEIFSKHQNVYSSALLLENNSFYIFCVGPNDFIRVYNSNGNLYKNIGKDDEERCYIESYEINDNKYIFSGGNKGINVFNYPSFSSYFCFKEEKDTNFHNYAKIIRRNNIYNLVDVGESNKIRIWDFNNKHLIKVITSNSNNMLGGFIFVNNVYLIIGSLDKEIKVFDDGIFVKSLNEHTSDVIGIKAVKDKYNNPYFVSYGSDKNIYLWSLN